jgi:hypothetical protein
MSLAHERIGQSSRSSHLPNFDHLVIEAFAKHLADPNNVMETNKQYSNLPQVSRLFWRHSIEGHAGSRTLVKT